MTAYFQPLAGVAVAVAVALLSPAEASAKGFVIVTWGDTITDIGTASPQAKQSHGSNKVGYKHHYWGVFWVDLWTSDGTYCVYDGKRYNPISPAEAARLLGQNESELTTPFLYRWPLGWLIFGPLIVIGGIAAALGKGESNDVAQLFQDARYQRALQILNERYTASAEATPARAAEGQNATPDNGGRFKAAFQAGVDHLIETGVARNEAERNLAAMFHVMA